MKDASIVSSRCEGRKFRDEAGFELAMIESMLTRYIHEIRDHDPIPRIGSAIHYSAFDGKFPGQASIGLDQWKIA